MTTGMPTAPATENATSRGGNRHVLALALLALVAAGAGIAWWQTRDDLGGEAEKARAALPAVDDTLARPPANVRVRVRVLNTSGVSGLARRATAHLRDYGFDVVDFASGRTDTTALTRIAVHTGHPEWGARLQKALGAGIIETDPDTSRFLDLTVYVGRDWRPPAETLRP